MNNNQQIEQGASSIIDTLAEKVAGQMEEANQDKPTAAQIQKKIEQIAIENNLSVGAVTMRLSRLRKKLKNLLDDLIYQKGENYDTISSK